LMFCVCLYRKDEREFVGTVYHKVSRRLETAIQMEWTTGSNDTKFAIAAKYCPDIDTTLRVLLCLLENKILIEIRLFLLFVKASKSTSFIVLLLLIW